MTSPPQNEPGREYAASSAAKDPLIGYDLNGRFRLLEVIGAGGWGKVYRARHLSLGTDVAVKVIHKHHMQDDANLKRLEQEAKVLSQLDSPAVVRVLDYGQSPAPYIAMEFFDAAPLFYWIRDAGAMKFEVAIELFVLLAEGLVAAHKLGIVHRDLKPGNILLNFDGKKLEAKILDFGLAKLMDHSSGIERLTATGELLGSPAYMSPEQWNGQADFRSDIYALGCIMYEVLAGKPPYTAQFAMDYLHKHVKETPKAITEVNRFAAFPPVLEDVVNKCMQKAPDKRYQTVTALLSDLKKIQVGRKPVVLIDRGGIASALKIAVPLVLVATLGLGIFLAKDSIIQSIYNSLVAQADNSLSNGNSDDALEKYRSAVSVAACLPKQDKMQLHALRMLSILFKDRKQLEEAKKLDQQIDLMTGSSRCRPELDAKLKQLAEMLAAGRNLQDLESRGASILAEAKASLGQQSMAVASCLDLLGLIELKKKNTKKSIDYHKQALGIAREFQERDDPVIADNLDHLAAALRADGQEKEADQFASEAIAIKSEYQARLESASSRINQIDSKSASDKTASANSDKSNTQRNKPTVSTVAYVPLAQQLKNSGKFVPLAEQEKDAVKPFVSYAEQVKKQKELDSKKTAEEKMLEKMTAPERRRYLRNKELRAQESQTLQSIQSELDQLKKQGKEYTVEAARLWEKMGSQYYNSNIIHDMKKRLSYAESCMQQGFNVLESTRTGRDAEVESNAATLMRIKGQLGKTAEGNAFYERWTKKGTISKASSKSSRISSQSPSYPRPTIYDDPAYPVRRSTRSNSRVSSPNDEYFIKKANEPAPGTRRTTPRTPTIITDPDE